MKFVRAGMWMMYMGLTSAVLAQQPPPLPSATPPPLPQPTQEKWYVADNAKQTGPFTIDEVRQKIQTGLVTRDTLVWAASLPSWKAAQQVQELAASFGTDTPPPALPAGAQQQALDAKAAKYLVGGTWHVQQNMGMMYTADISVTYNENGSFGGFINYQGQGISKSVPIMGTWTVKGVTETSFSLTTRDANGANTALVEIVDPNTCRDPSSGNLSRRSFDD